MLKYVQPLAAIVMLLTADTGLAQDVEAGKAVFKKCVACHQVGPDAQNKAGPVLTDVVGRQAGSVEGFKYRASIVAAGENGLVWTEAGITNYLEDPTNFLRTYLDDPNAKSGMSFKLKKEQDRLDVVAFLKSKVSGDTAAAQPEAPVETRSVEEVIADQVFTAEFMADPANFEAGKELWYEQCTHCHGFKAYPGKAPKLKPAKYKPEFVFKRVYKGFKKMPGWSETYSIDEIRQIVTYVKSKSFSP